MITAAPLPSGWRLARLSQLTEVEAPIIYGILQPGPEVPQGVPYVRPTEIVAGVIDLKAVRRTSTHIAQRYARSRLRAGDVLLSIVGTIGKVAFVRPELEGANITQSSVRIRPNERVVTREWIAYSLRSPAAQSFYDQQRLGTGVPRLNVAQVRDFAIPLPPLAEQRRIVAKLDELLARSRAAREALGALSMLLPRYRQAVLASAYVEDTAEQVMRPEARMPARPADSRTFRLSEIAGDAGLFVDGDWVESKDQDPSGEVRLIQLADVGDGVFKNRSDRFLTMKKSEELRCTYLQPGDVLVSRMADPLGRACMLPDLGQTCVTAVDICIVRPDRSIADPEWLMHTINAPQVRRLIELEASGTTRKRVSRSRLGEIAIRVPSLEEQRVIAKRIRTALCAIDEVENQVDTALEQVAQLESAVLERAFRGELLQQDPNDEPVSIPVSGDDAGETRSSTAKRRRRKRART